MDIGGGGFGGRSDGGGRGRGGIWEDAREGKSEDSRVSDTFLDSRWLGIIVIWDGIIIFTTVVGILLNIVVVLVVVAVVIIVTTNTIALNALRKNS